MTSTNQTQLESTIKLLMNTIAPKHTYILNDGGSPEYDKLKNLAYLIMSAEMKENSNSDYYTVVLPFKDIQFECCKENNSLSITTIYDAFYINDNFPPFFPPSKVFKYIYNSIYLKLLKRYCVRTITCVILDVMIYCIVERIEIKIMDLINLNWNEILKEKPKYSYFTKCNFDKAMPDGYMKDILFKAVEQEERNQKLQRTYSIVDIVNQLKTISLN